MILDYFRPKTVSDAITLLKTEGNAIPLAGGTTLRSLARQKDIRVVDLQNLGLSGIRIEGDWIMIGAMTTLNEINASNLIPKAVKDAIQLEGTTNTRNLATLGGRVNAVEGRSTVVTTLIALDAITQWDQESKEIDLGEWLAIPEQKPGCLMSSLKFNRHISVEFQVINKTKLDLPILCVATARWKSGRVRVAVGGFGKSPQMVFDGPDGNGAALAAQSACSMAEDAAASSKYREEMAGLLTTRCLDKLEVRL